VGLYLVQAISTCFYHFFKEYEKSAISLFLFWIRIKGMGWPAKMGWPHLVQFIGIRMPRKALRKGQYARRNRGLRSYWNVLRIRLWGWSGRNGNLKKKKKQKKKKKKKKKKRAHCFFWKTKRIPIRLSGDSGRELCTRNSWGTTDLRFFPSIRLRRGKILITLVYFIIQILRW